MDIFPAYKRSAIMRAVKSKSNKSTELKLIDIFRTKRITGWRRNYKLFGNPDFVFPKLKTAVFVDGCFWHGHECRNTKPAGNKTYWDNKIKRNIQRDKEVSERLTNKKWKVLRIWECELKKSDLPKKIKRLAKQQSDCFANS